MENSHYSLSWDKFPVSMCAGFSLLQQNGEMVDLTLAADGHLVKVHQVILGVASTYIKELIRSADCKHPVIFLNNISYKTLCNILEFVYTGEVSIDGDNLTAFLETARALQIKGLEQHNVESDNNLTSQVTAPVKKFQIEVLGNNEAKLTEEVQLPAAVRNIQPKRKHSLPAMIPKYDFTKKICTANTSKLASTDHLREDENIHSDSEDDDVAPDDLSENEEAVVTKTQETRPSNKPAMAELQYTVSNQGSLQLILNRYIYSLRYRKRIGGVIRWQCVDNRRNGCTATVLTQNNLVIQRMKLHNHLFHDRRIRGKYEKNAVYSALQAAEDATEIMNAQKSNS